MGHRAGIDRSKLIHAEIVADGHVEVGMVRGGGAQHLGVERGVVLLRALGVRVALNLERERAARGTLRVDGVLRAFREGILSWLAIAWPVKAWLVGWKLVEQHFSRLPGCEAGDARLARRGARRGAVFEIRFQAIGREDIDRHRLVGGAPEHQGQPIEGRHVGGKRDLGVIAFPRPFLLWSLPAAGPGNR